MVWLILVAADTIFGISPIDATAIATIALAVVGALAFIANVFLAAMNARMARATKDEAVATEKEAKATLDQATATREQAQIANETLRELRRSRELEWRPILVRDELNAGVKDGKAWRSVTLRNIGRGPALNCLFVREEMGAGDAPRFLASQPVSLRAGQELDLQATELEQPPHADMFTMYGDRFPRELLICQDQFGTSFQFRPGFPSPNIWTYENEDQGERELGWVTGMKVLLSPSRLLAEADLPSGHAFVQATWVQGNYGFVHSTIAMEAVPPTDLQPTDPMRLTTEAWVKRIRPNAGPSSMRQARWQDPPGDNVYQAPWGAELEPGPAIAIRHPLDVQARPPRPSAPLPPEGDLSFPDLVKLWTWMIHGEMGLMERLGARRVRLGLTMIPYGSLNDKPRVVGLTFGALTAPKQMVPVPSHEIRPWPYQSSVFPVKEWPAGEIERAVRDLLRMFGYVEVDELIAALNLQTPPEGAPP